MTVKQENPLLALSVLVVLSLVVAYILFGVLQSTGLVKNDYAEFGGAAAGFLATLYLLHKWYSKMRARENQALRSELETLKRTLTKINIPEFDTPKDYSPYIDQEHSMLFCYPDKWRREPVALEIQGVFSEEPMKLQAGDIFPGKFVVTISTPGQQAYSLKEVKMIAERMGLDIEDVNASLGVEITDKTHGLKVPLEQLLPALGVSGDTKADQIYNLNYDIFKLMSESDVRKDYAVVGGIRSLLVEMQLDAGLSENLVQINVVTYVEQKDEIYTFSFTDNLSDRDKAVMMSKQVLATVKFW